LRAQTPSLADAFSQVSSLGRSGNIAARGQISGSKAQSVVPAYTTNAPQTSYFNGGGILAPSSAVVNACAQPSATGGAADPACAAVNFSQSNPGRRPAFNIGPDDPLRAGARVITNNPQSMAGNLAGSYSGCSTITTTTPDRFEKALCHEYRLTETNTCNKVLTVTAVFTPGCTDGQLLTRVIADPCPTCVDYLAFDFSCGVNSYRMHALTLDRSNGQLYMDLGIQTVPGALNTSIPKTAGPTRIDGDFCYETFYSQSCSGASCSIGAWFANPCQETSYYGVNAFVMPTTVSFVDSWSNQCSTLEARAR
jgi:hypothetical protein